MNKKILMLSTVLVIILTLCSDTGAYDDEDTHKDITKKAVTAFEKEFRKLEAYLKDSIGIIRNNGYETVLKRKKIIEWLQKGARDEDHPMCQATTHFHDPLRGWAGSGLYGEQGWITDKIIMLFCSLCGWPTSPAISNTTWATRYLGPSPDSPKAAGSPFAWDEARTHFYRALTLKSEKERESELADTFLALGHILHLLQDVSVPAHVRNDFTSHLTFSQYEANPLNSLRNPFEFYVLKHPEVITGASAEFPDFPGSGVALTDFWDRDMYTGTNPSADRSQGISEIVNANFFSEGTMPPNDPPPDRQYPHPAFDSSWQLCTEDVPVYDDEQQDFVTYKRRYAGKDGCKPHATISLLNRPDTISQGNLHNLKLFLDDNVHRAYAEAIGPLAIGYSARLLEYFFRGTLEISSPDKHLYSVTDGAVIPQQFTHITASVKNTSCGGAEEIGEGTILAVAKYRKRTDYQPDLSADPPTAESREPHFTFSVSAPIAIFSLDGQKEFRFDFADDPIPAGITDLYLFAVFRGRLGKEKETGVAVGLKDLNEPRHICIWNTTDRVWLDGILRTAEEIRSIPELSERLDSDGDGEPDICINPLHVDEELTFYSDDGPLGSVYYASVPPGRYGRIIILAGLPDAGYSCTSTCGMEETLHPTTKKAVNQEDSSGSFISTSPHVFRNIRTHAFFMHMMYSPDMAGVKTAPWPGPADPLPLLTTGISH